VDDDVRQTRCATCEAEHEYRQGKAPPPRRAKSHAALTPEGTDAARPVLAVPRPQAEAAAEAADGPDLAEMPDLSAVVPQPAAEPADTPLLLDGSPLSPEQDVAEPNDPREDDGPVHRRLIRATFPRPEGHVPERREPEFTVRQPAGRGRGEVDGNRVGYRTNSSRNQRHGQPGSYGNFGARPQGGGWGSDGQRGSRGPSGHADNRQGGGGQPRGPRQGGAGRKGGR